MTSSCGNLLHGAIRRSPTATALAGLLAIAACGGGGGGGSSTPTVAASLSAGSTKALVGETVTVTWQSTLATACSLSGLPAGSGGALAPSGSLQVSFASAGTASLQLTCTAPGATTGSASASVEVQAVTTFSVPTNMAEVSYPTSYSVPTARLAQLNLDPCALDVEFVSYPQAWLGSRPLPTVVGAPLAANLGRGVSVKDIMLVNNPAFVLPGAPGAPNGCNGDLRAQFRRLLSRLQAIGGDHVVMVQWHWASVRNDGSWTILPAEASFGPLPDADLEFFVSEAHAKGIKVLMTNQIQGVVNANGQGSLPPFTMDNLRKWFAAYQTFIAERAVAFQRMGMDYWELGCNVCIYRDDGDGSAEASSLFLSEYDTALRTVRARFTGKVWMHAVPWLFEHPEFIARLDMIATSPWPFLNPRLTANEASNVSVGLLRQRLASFESSARFLQQFGKPLLVLMDWVQARADVLTRPGYLEETGCTSSLEDIFATDPNVCLQREVVTDFSVQAIATEAMLESASASALLAGSVVIGGQYWVTDPLMPQTAFPNFGTTLRNKPAEGVLKAWFAR